jgi:hypothetical protein
MSATHTHPVAQEYLAPARAIALNELLLLQHLCGKLPEDTYNVSVQMKLA